MLLTPPSSFLKEQPVVINITAHPGYQSPGLDSGGTLNSVMIANSFSERVHKDENDSMLANASTGTSELTQAKSGSEEDKSGLNASVNALIFQELREFETVSSLAPPLAFEQILHSYSTLVFTTKIPCRLHHKSFQQSQEILSLSSLTANTPSKLTDRANACIITVLLYL